MICARFANAARFVLNIRLGSKLEMGEDMKKAISKLMFLMLALVICSGMAVAGTIDWTDAVTFASLMDGTDDQITIGDKIFADFDLLGPISAGAVNVRAGVDLETGIYFLQFQGAFSAAAGTESDYAIFYSVESTGLGIDGIDQSFNLSGGDGEVLIGETVFDAPTFGNLLAQSTVAFNSSTGLMDVTDPEGEEVQGDDLIIDPAFSKIYVTKDILVIGGNDRVAASIITQSFHQPIPEPGSLLLLGSGLLGMGIFLRKRAR